MRRPAAATMILGVALFGIALPLYFAGQRSNPPGFFLDECSVAYNALSIARTGADEHGTRYPLFFKAFGEYKNPVYIYLLAGLFRVMEPENLTARRFSAVLGILAAGILAWIAQRSTRSRTAAAVVFLTALFTPNLFEISRLAFEVAVYPLALALFLAAAWRASQEERWGSLTIAALVVTLTMVAFAYSIGRLQGPLLAVSLLLFLTKERRAGVLAVLIGFVLVAVVPIVLYNRSHGGALTKRFSQVSDLSSAEPLESTARIVRRYAANGLDPAALALRGDPNERHHVQGSGGGILIATLALSLLAAIRTLRESSRSEDRAGGRERRWWIFLLVGSLLAPIPASLTNDLHHALRLVPYPVFLILLGARAMMRPRSQLIVIAACAMALAQAGFFLHRFHRDGGNRHVAFDSGYRQAVAAAAARPERPIHTTGAFHHANGYWYGALMGMPQSDFIPSWATPAEGAIVISDQPACGSCEVIAVHRGFTTYVKR